MIIRREDDSVDEVIKICSNFLFHSVSRENCKVLISVGKRHEKLKELNVCKLVFSL